MSDSDQRNRDDEPAAVDDSVVEPVDELADLDDIDFDLDEVENKIAPLALALRGDRTRGRRR